MNWLNAHYIKNADLDALAPDITKRMAALGVAVRAEPPIKTVLELYRERANNLNQLAADIAYFYIVPETNAKDAEKHLTDEIKPVMAVMAETLKNTTWTAEAIHEVIAATVKENVLKFPKIAMPLRVMLAGIAQSPSIDQVMAILGKETVLNRMAHYLK